MSARIVINGKEIQRPLAQVLAGFIMFAILAALATVFVFLFLPLLGVAVTVAVGIFAVVLTALVIAVSVLFLWGTLINAMQTPFTASRSDGRFGSRVRLPPPD